MKRISILLFSLIIVYYGCSGAKSTTDTLKIEVMTQQSNSWVNLMPGSKPSFFISGSIKIKNDENIALDSIQLLKCNILQEGKTIYNLIPGFRSVDDIKAPINSGTDRIFTFYLSPGTPINKELDMDKLISIELYLSALNKVKLHIIDNINVIKTY
ncbi:MAG: hypothetical protein P4L27_00805 [Ignavibacteriaceae bacterium]|nr:hypothetical protein [Ignavibacteriaceae bacterium]